ncbi:GntR family transcriptional regulator [Parasphingorhabdus sp.]|uniref:GntR family transcriptional regulator n=1 Tax=Parasphingorhabdus sp. TaxID=2709688 RepID=UPI0030017FEF
MKPARDLVTSRPAPAEEPVPTIGADAVAQALRERIQANQLEPGVWLREARVCDEFSVGRSVARRALRILGEDGLVEIEENRGARISATTVEEVFELYELRAALYGLAVRVACLRASDLEMAEYLADIDRLLAAADDHQPADHIIRLSEEIFSAMASHSSADARKMIASVRRKTRFHYSYVALAINSDRPGPYAHWRTVRTALVARDAEQASQSARDILYFMQGEVARIMLSRGSRIRESGNVLAGADQ